MQSFPFWPGQEERPVCAPGVPARTEWQGPAPLTGGFTLVEVLVSVAILATGLVLVLQTFQNSTMALREVRDSLLAGNALRQQADQLAVDPDAAESTGAAISVATAGSRFVTRSEVTEEGTAAVSRPTRKEAARLVKAHVSVDRPDDGRVLCEGWTYVLRWRSE